MPLGRNFGNHKIPSKGSAQNPFSFLNADLLNNLSQCPLCKQKYRPIQAALVEDSPEAHLIYMKCPNCQGAIVYLITNQGPLLSSTGLVTDLALEDLQRIRNKNTISADEVLNLAEVLNQEKNINQLIK